MVHGIHVNDESWGGRGEDDAGDFGRRVRRVALDAHRILSRPDSPLDELIGLHWRVFHLLDEVPGARATGVLRWLLAVRQEIGARLQSWSVEDLESLGA
jgi:hypothetical protein